MSTENKDKKTQLGGNIALVGFENLELSELDVVKKLVRNYVRKLGNSGNYKEMRLTLQQHPHGKSFKHEIKGFAIFEEGRFNSDAMEWNLYSAVSQVCERILEEVKQTRRKEDDHKQK